MIQWLKLQKTLALSFLFKKTGVMDNASSEQLAKHPNPKKLIT
jgi:hypothetical protein